MVSTQRSDVGDSRTYLPTEEAAAAEVIDFLSHLRASGRDTPTPVPRLVSTDGQSVNVPESMFAALVQVAEAMQAGLAVTVAPHHLTLSTQEAADLMQVSRTTLVRLLESGVIPFDKPNRHRKVRLDDLLRYREAQRNRAEQALADMVADSERLGLYDDDPQTSHAAVHAARRATSQNR